MCTCILSRIKSVCVNKTKFVFACFVRVFCTTSNDNHLVQNLKLVASYMMKRFAINRGDVVSEILLLYRVYTRKLLCFNRTEK